MRLFNLKSVRSPRFLEAGINLKICAKIYDQIRTCSKCPLLGLGVDASVEGLPISCSQRKVTLSGVADTGANRSEGQVREEISKVLRGHSIKDVASRYGDGFQLDVLRKWLSKTL